MPRANMNRRTAHSQLLRSFEGLTEEQKVTLFMKLRYKHHQTMGELLYIARRAYAAGYEDAIEGLGFDALETARHELVAAYYADELQRISNGGMLDINGAVMLLYCCCRAVALTLPCAEYEDMADIAMGSGDLQEQQVYDIEPFEFNLYEETLMRHADLDDDEDADPVDSTIVMSRLSVDALPTILF